jgi:hypothetical protein
MRKLVLMAVAFALTACAEPYDPPQVFDENFSNASGATSEAPSQGFAGLSDLAQMNAPAGRTVLPTRVLWTHGMCSPSDGTQTDDPYVWWQVRTRDLLAAYPGAQQVGAPLLSELSPGGSQLIKETLSVPGRAAGSTRTVELWFFDWSPLTKPFKLQELGDIEAGKGNPYTYERATLNGKLKQGLIKDCLADVVVYLGINGSRIRNDAQIAVCEMLDGQFDRDTGCAGASGARYTALISESLGSSILLDAFRSLRLDYVAARKEAIERLMATAPDIQTKPPSDNTSTRKPNPAADAYLASVTNANAAMGRATANSADVSAAMASLTSFYMLANQIPLLNFAGQPVNETRNLPLEEFMASATEMRKQGEGAAALTVVAFVDPNDLLSFRLIPKSGRARVVNFVVSNADTYLGYAEMPDSAHCNYIRNGYVMHAIVFGYGGGVPQSGPVDDPEKCL